MLTSVPSLPPPFFLKVPGHAQGWIAGSAPGTVLKGRFATTGKVSAQLNPTDPATAELVQRILAEMVEDATNGRASNGDGNGDGNSINVDVDGRMHGNSNPDVADAAAAAGVDDDDVAKNKQLPALPYLHIGGDEVDLDAYGKTTSEALRAWATFDRTMRQGTRPRLVQMRSNVRTASVALSCLFESAVPFSSVQFVFKNAQCYDNLTINKLHTHPAVLEQFGPAC